MPIQRFQKGRRAALMKISLPRHAHANASGLSSRIQQYSPLIEIREISVAGVSECVMSTPAY